jgi:hypothetical protein
VQAPAAHGLAQALPPDAVALAAQGDLEPTRAVAALMEPKTLISTSSQIGSFSFPHLFLSLLPHIVGASCYGYYLAKAHQVLLPLRFDKAITAHRL